MAVLLDDYLVRDWLVGPDRVRVEAVGGEDLATTNLGYSRYTSVQPVRVLRPERLPVA